MDPTREPQVPVSEKLVAIVKGFERVIAAALVLLLMIVVVLVIVELARHLLKDLTLARAQILDEEQLFELLGSFLLVLVGTELLTSLKAYVREGAVQIEVVLEVALVALAQKVIILNPRSSPVTQFGLSTLIVALAGAFWLVRAGRRRLRLPTSRG